MRTLVLDPPPEMTGLLERRRRLGLDGYDEVWEGTYHLAPMARSRHGWLLAQLTRLLGPAADAVHLIGVGPVNLGEPHDFRVPDLAYLRELDPQALYLASAAVLVEVVSAGDETYEKFAFYAAHAVDEILVADPQTRRIHLFQRAGDAYQAIEHSGLLGLDVDQINAGLAWPQ